MLLRRLPNERERRVKAESRAAAAAAAAVKERENHFGCSLWLRDGKCVSDKNQIVAITQ